MALLALLLCVMQSRGDAYTLHARALGWVNKKLLKKAHDSSLLHASYSSTLPSESSPPGDVSILSAQSVIKDARLTPPYAFSKQQFVYVVLTSIFVTCLIVADVIGVKIFEIKLPFSILGFSSIEHTCGMLTFPVTFLLGDIINEYYGAKATRTTVYIGLAMSIFVFFMMNIAQVLPYLDRPFNVSPLAFNTIFGSAKLMYCASIIAYLVGQLMDIWLFGVIKKITKGKYLWLRATGSTLVSQLLDSFVVSYIAFGPGKRLAGQIGKDGGLFLACFALFVYP